MDRGSKEAGIAYTGGTTHPISGLRFTSVDRESGLDTELRLH